MPCTNQNFQRAERNDIDAKLKPINNQIKVLNEKKAEIEAAMSAICIEGRNNYSRGGKFYSHSRIPNTHGTFWGGVVSE